MTGPMQEDFPPEAAPASLETGNLPVPGADAPPLPPRPQPLPPSSAPLPPGGDEPAADDQAERFAAGPLRTAAAGPLLSTPSVTLGGVTIASVPDTSLTNVVALDGLTVSWGRAEVMDQPSPQTASFSLFDPSMSWAVGQDLIGQLVKLNRSGTNPSSGNTTVSPFFVGRVTGVKVTRQIVRRPDGSRVHGALIAFTASALSNDLANRIPREDWPAETMDARRARIQTYATNVCSNIYLRGYWQVPQVAPVAAANQVSIYDHLQSLYVSSGPDRWTWTPWNQQVVQLERRDHPSSRTQGALAWNLAGEGTARDGKGAYAISLATPSYDGGMPGLNLFLDSQMIEFDPQDGMKKDITSRITRIDVQFPDIANGYQNSTRTTLVAGVDENVSGIRTASVQSIVNNGTYAATASSDLAFMAGREAASWKLDTFTVRPGVLGGFESWDQLSNLLLVGSEVLSMVFIQRSWFAQMGIRPVFGICGGAIRYAGGEWSFDCHVSPVNTLPMAQHPIAWDEIDDGSTSYQLQWWDTDNSRGLHESLTYEDIGYVGFGMGVTTVPPDHGWDAPQ